MSWKKDVRNWNGKLYKILKGNKSCHGGGFEWDLPKDEKPGDWTPTIKNVKMCSKGYHLTTHYAHWADKEDVLIYEAEGDVVEFDGRDKVVCTKARLLRLVENPFPKNNIGKNNSGNYNTGDSNSGDRNSGDFNLGFGNSNDENFGDLNSGYKNSGNYNSGNYNSGDDNSGDYNYGNYNSGDGNSGNYNSGNWNSGNNNSGYFCRHKMPIVIFEKPAPKGWNPKFPNWMKPGLSESYYLAWQKAFENADIEGIEELLALPNFDYEIFEEITSITKKQIEEKFPNLEEVINEEKSLRESAKIACENILGSEFYLSIKDNVALPRILRMAAEKAFLEEIEDENTNIIRKSLKVLEQDGALV